MEDNQKAQLAKEIASFANCEGGWLVVGIDDKTKEVSPIQRQDYSQKIGKIVTRISPMPEIETKFLSMPEDKKRGVLVVYVYEGRNAPYICNGSIYVRSGSSKEPINPADRGNIEYLYERSKNYRKEIEKFCQRDYFYPYSNRLQQKVTYPIANVYLKNVSARKDKFFNVYANRDKFIEFVKKEYNLFEHISYSMNSIIFIHKALIPGTNSGTFVFELFYDWSCKFSIPVGLSDTTKKQEYIEIYEKFGIDIKQVEEFRMSSGSDVFNTMLLGMYLFEKIAKKYKLKEKDYAYCLEIENAAEVVVAFWGKKYERYIQQYGLPYAHKENNRGQIIFLRDHPNLKFQELPSYLIADGLAAAFGFRSDSIFEILHDSNETLYPETK